MHHLSLESDDLVGYVAQQIRTFIPDSAHLDPIRLRRCVELGLERSLACFSRVGAPRYVDGAGDTTFSHLHAGQYAAFLYYTANSAFSCLGDDDLATRLYLLNRMLFSIDVFYEVELPDVFYWEHPVGTVLGRARYGEYLTIYQHCTVGGNTRLEYPELGRGVTLFAGATVLGSSTIGDDVQVSAGSVVLDETILAGMSVFGRSPDLVVRARRRATLPRWFRGDAVTRRSS
jgi:serine O-acetyltransferase